MRTALLSHWHLANGIRKMELDAEHGDLSPQYYPEEIKHDLDGIDLTQREKNEILTCAYQYTRCVIPEYTDERRYLAFMRTIIIGTIAEFRGDMVDVAAGDRVLGYSIDNVMAALFEGTGVQYVKNPLHFAENAVTEPTF